MLTCHCLSSSSLDTIHGVASHIGGTVVDNMKSLVVIMMIEKFQMI